MIWKENHRASSDPGEVFLDMVESYGFMLIKTLWWLLKHPVIWVPGVIIAADVYLLGPWSLVWFFGSFATILIVWRLVRPGAFKRRISRPVYNRIRRIFFYEMQWRATMVDAGMLKTLRGRPDRVPKIKRFESNGWSDKVLVKLVRGQLIEKLMDNAPNIASAFGSDECRVKYDRPGYAWLVFPLKDPLASPIAPFPITEDVDLENVPVGLTDEGDVWTLPVTSPQGSHFLGAATTGGGKSNVPWALVYGISALIRDGRVRMWVADPKGGVEFKRGRKLWYRYADRTKDIMDMLKEAVVDLEARELRQADDTRMHVPTVEEPLNIIVIDEILSITALAKSTTRVQFQHLLGLLLTRGRAVGFDVIALSQDATKEMLSLRGFFPRRWVGRLEEAIQVDMVLGDGARGAGARADDHRVVPSFLPGVGFVKIEGYREPVRVRSCRITDEDIDYMVQNYAPIPDEHVAVGGTPERLRKTMESKTARSGTGKIRLTPRLEVEREAWLQLFKAQIDGDHDGVEQLTEQLEIVEAV